MAALDEVKRAVDAIYESLLEGRSLEGSLAAAGGELLSPDEVVSLFDRLETPELREEAAVLVCDLGRDEFVRLSRGHTSWRRFFERLRTAFTRVVRTDSLDNAWRNRIWRQARPRSRDEQKRHEAGRWRARGRRNLTGRRFTS